MLLQSNKAAKFPPYQMAETKGLHRENDNKNMILIGKRQPLKGITP